MKITKKLRDVTKEELKEWYRINCDNHCDGCIFDNVYCCIINGNHQWVHHKDLYSDKFLNQIIEVGVPDILDKKEKEYLSAVIKPFRNRVEYIQKHKMAIGPYEYIGINIKGVDEDIDDEICLPIFKKGKMYKNMESDKEYKLEELGL